MPSSGSAGGEKNVIHRDEDAARAFVAGEDHELDWDGDSAYLVVPTIAVAAEPVGVAVRLRRTQVTGAERAPSRRLTRGPTRPTENRIATGKLSGCRSLHREQFRVRPVVAEDLVVCRLYLPSVVSAFRSAVVPSRVGGRSRSQSGPRQASQRFDGFAFQIRVEVAGGLSSTSTSASARRAS